MSPDYSGSVPGCPHDDVAVVVPVRNDAAALAGAVATIAAQDCRVVEIALAVGPSDDDTAAVAARLAAADPRITVVDNPSGATPTALNAAIAATTAPVVVRVDARSELPAGYIHRAVETLARTGAANVGGVQHAVGTTPTQRAVAAAMTSPVGVGGARFHRGGDEGPVDTVYLGVFRRDALASVGGFADDMIRNQDYELNWRLRQAGHVVWFDPALVVDYAPRSTLGALARQFFQYGRWRRETLHRHPRSLKTRQLAAPVATLAVPAALAAALTGVRPAWTVPAGYVAVLIAGAVGAPGSLRPGDRARLPAVFAVMHFAWGSGFLVGSPLRRRARRSR